MVERGSWMGQETLLLLEHTDGCQLVAKLITKYPVVLDKAHPHQHDDMT